MSKATTCKQALINFEAAKSLKTTEAEKVSGASAPVSKILLLAQVWKHGGSTQVELMGMCPPIEKMDSSLNSLTNCRHLALSTNNIDKIGSLSGLQKLEILSLGRNCLKKLENLDSVCGTLRELWVSYNQIDRLVGWSALWHKMLSIRHSCTWCTEQSTSCRQG